MTSPKVGLGCTKGTLTRRNSARGPSRPAGSHQAASTSWPRSWRKTLTYDVGAAFSFAGAFAGSLVFAVVFAVAFAIGALVFAGAFALVFAGAFALVFAGAFALVFAGAFAL